MFPNCLLIKYFSHKISFVKLERKTQKNLTSKPGGGMPLVGSGRINPPGPINCLRSISVSLKKKKKEKSAGSNS